MSAQHTPHPVAVIDAPQWLRTFAMQFKGETRATLEMCANGLERAPEILEALKWYADKASGIHGNDDLEALEADQGAKARHAIAKATGGNTHE